MQYILAIIAGVVQGVAEFLPISSSGHLIILHDVLNFNLPDNLSFDVMLHLGTFFALLIFFWSDIIRLAQAFFASLVKWNYKGDVNQRLAWLIIIGTIPAVLAGYFLNDLIDQNLHSGRTAAAVVAVMLVVVAILFWVLEKYAQKVRDLNSLNWRDSIIIGLSQAIALIPGTSRSGITISAGLWLKFKREEAAKFSFLLSMPVILGASVSSFLSADWLSSEWSVVAVGFLAALVSGYFAVKFLMNYLINHSLNIFAWYRVILAGLIVIWLLV